MANTNILGIFQSDIIIRTALEAAIMDLRAEPWNLEYVFASLPQDSISKDTYGQATLDRAKAWFLSNNIAILTQPVLNELELPAVTIKLLSSEEAVPETSLGDIHSTASESNNADAPILAGPFVPASYDTETGLVTLSSALAVPVFPGQVLIDYKGRKLPIEDVWSDTEIKLADNTIADFTKCILKSAEPVWSISIESASYRETYQIGIHAQAHPEYAIWLHSIVVYCLLKYKQTLMEARGFERSVLSSSALNVDEQLPSTELAFSRYINVTGYVRQYWPKAVTQKIDGILFDKLRVSGAEKVPDPESAETALWVGLDDD